MARVTVTSTFRLLFLALSLAATNGCLHNREPAGSPVETVWESGPPKAADAGQPAMVALPPKGSRVDGPNAVGPQESLTTLPGSGYRDRETAVALVNGEPITRDRFVDMLVDSRGVAVLEQLVLLTAARQKAASMSLTITPGDIAAAEESALRRIAAPVGDPERLPLDRPAAERLLADLLRLKGLSRAEWDCRMEQRAWLNRIAEAEVDQMEITEPMLLEEYNLTYGERVQIRHIQTSTQEAVNRAAERLKKEPFEQVAREVSENPITREQGGLMPPFTRHDGAVPPLIRERAFGMEVGEVSGPLREGAWYHIIRLERHFPPSGVGFENIDREGLRERLKDRLVHRRIEELDAELFRAARIEIRQPELEKAFRQKHRG